MLDLSKNSFTGWTPDSYFSTSRKLWRLDLSSNRLRDQGAHDLHARIARKRESKLGREGLGREGLGSQAGLINYGIKLKRSASV